MKFDLCETCSNTLYQGGAFGPCGTCVDGNNYEQKRELLAPPTALEDANAVLDRMDKTGGEMMEAMSTLNINLDAYMRELEVRSLAPLGDLVDAQARKNTPITTGVLDYFPDAIAAVAQCSKAGNDQHNPGQPLHWAREKSTDHADCIGRHLIQRGTFDSDGIRHSAKLAWRALANLQVEIEEDRCRG